MPGPLLLVPTESERRALVDVGLGIAADPRRCRVVGFGPVAAAAAAAAAFAEDRPSHAVLVGIAGTYDSRRCAVGEARLCGRVRLVGLGARHGADVLPPLALGLPQRAATPERAAVWDELPLRAGPDAPLALTVLAASGDRSAAAGLAAREAPALLEDMEGFGVALAAADAAVDLHLVRGASNVAGDRDSARWRVRDALGSAASLVRSVWG